MQLLSIAAFLAKLLADPTLQALTAQFIAWLKTLTPAQQLAFASKYETHGGFGCSHGEDCPQCPDELLPVQEALFASLKGE